MKKKIVLQKFIADSGYCSRRKAGELIKDGDVFVNGEVAELGQRVGNEDEVEINGHRPGGARKKLELAKKKIYIKLNKPVGYVCTSRWFKGEKNVFEIVDVKERLFAVGRLDKDSRGLVLLTNDGELTQKLTHPKFEHEKIYEVEVQGSLGKKDIDNIINNFKKGVDIGKEEGVVKVKEIKFLDKSKFKIVLTEGKKRQIRRMFGALKFRVNDLARIAIDNLTLGTLNEGEWSYLNEEEVVGIKK